MKTFEVMINLYYVDCRRIMIARFTEIFGPLFETNVELPLKKSCGRKGRKVKPNRSLSRIKTDADNSGSQFQISSRRYILGDPGQLVGAGNQEREEGSPRTSGLFLLEAHELELYYRSIRIKYHGDTCI